MWDPYASTTQPTPYDPALAASDLFSSLAQPDPGAVASSGGGTEGPGIPALVQALANAHQNPHTHSNSHPHSHSHTHAPSPIHDYTTAHTHATPPLSSFSPGDSTTTGLGVASTPSSSTNTGGPSSSSIGGERLTAEEKRLRNNSASARFRVKKKMQEKQLVQHTMESAEKLTQLQGKAQELERENKWLKNLVLEKSKKTRPEGGG
ncbi:Regulatory protein cys-3 [Ceratocystis fimbriata CBS 114723]|uniref:Regulatory protein cys-3 n=1 Tax=Ceratocystis fimbriata CBS 114723 TaxID=1035309 RepID=A0A2C5WS35_9PEZI|nr:Regulatory protein cys-3 [Ceratocystis fimbriata CBS 114723]